MSRSVFETILGAVVLLIAGVFVIFAYNSSTTHRGVKDGYVLHAVFSKVGSVTVGTDVRIAGIKVGRVSNLSLDQRTFLARLSVTLDESIQLPRDSVITVASEGLLGGNFVAITPGGDPDTLKNGETFAFTEAPTNLSDLLARFVFSSASGGNGEKTVTTPTVSPLGAQP
ncbi:MAG: outer membrane lipid asymmetry maintenance protein MlaD [Holosporales bacterium]|jgi:phospholipid/cholesterol/gamma-HCH transport system substrate-binding protein